VRYSFDDRLLASRSWSDGTIRLWPAPF
jgi:hypothetical protein